MGAKKGVLTFLGVLVLIAAMSAVALAGFDLGFTRIPSVSEGIKLGLDLVGGLIITYEADVPEGTEIAEIDKNMDTVTKMLRERLNANGYTEAVISRDSGRNNRIRVEIPNVTDPEEAIKMLGSTAKLEFQDADGNIVMEGTDIESAEAVQRSRDTGGMEWVVEMKFIPESVEKFSEATKNAAARAAEGKNYISIVLDGEVKSSPSVKEQITQSSAVIQFGSGASRQQAQEAVETARLINIGQLPFSLKKVQHQIIGPQLGERSLETSLFAGMLGLVLVIVFMISIYRLPGLVASVALLFYTVLICVILAVAQVNLSLPGIAGIILSIGMAVDSNILIYERMKEELRSGKTLRSSIETGFRRALSAVIDTHVTTTLASLVLWYWGTGPIIGFAVALFIGVLLSLFTVLVVSRLLLRGLVDMNVTNLWAYGA